ncbi:DNA phosphorothioation system sulfurtransferase DndC [Methylotetracoccus oryzae]|uniref:DNA phosphorothioation system sulfurtransferase DndC n=1 Tax=Methylotetracoccus oryzae TaxID=1919059 RepID=UPI00111A8230|nr:DNA phosphorothioation system sulfurtransferase DndC [Methylotetracoccus oryzae]
MESTTTPSSDTKQAIPVQHELEFGQDEASGSGPRSPRATTPRRSAFAELGFQATIALLHEEIRELYLADDVPWIIGYSGGKDSTATLQLVWGAILQLPAEQRKKTVYVISTDTLVENPIVSAWVRASLSAMRAAANEQGTPVLPRLLHPKLEDSFWVNLIGRGYPAPRPKFRWCTERLKIRPSNSFISQIVTENGEAILCLGARRDESTARARVLDKNSRYRVRDRLSPSSTLPGCMIYTPVESWSSDDIWFFLNNQKNPWGASNKELMGMYAGASPDGECPLVVDDSTPSCGDSRFGCWVCTLVEKDKSMTAMIQNDADKEWLMPLLDLRNALDFRNNHDGSDESSDHHLRDFRRLTGAVQLMTNGKPVPGPYTQTSREAWLAKLLAAQSHIRRHGPPDVRAIELITLEELQEIRRIWVIDKHELEDSLPRIYQEVTGDAYPGRPLDDDLVLGEAEMRELSDLCGDDRLHYELTRELLSITRQQRALGRRAGLFEQLEKTFKKHFYDDKDDAITRAQSLANEREKRKREREFASLGSIKEPSTAYLEFPE